jgi:preprotein translocase subunit SecD
VNRTQEIPVLHMQLSDTKAAEFREFTKRHIDQRVDFVAAGKRIAQPIIRGEVTNGQIGLPFGFPDEAQEVVNSLSKR